MSLSTLRFIRFFAPAIILVVLTYVLAKMLGIRSADVPVSFNDLGYNLSYLVIAAFYDFTPLRSLAHEPFLVDVNETIRARLVSISGLPDHPTKFAWKRVRNVFYWLVDNDKSLEKRAEEVMFNGAMMTCFADLTAISFLFLVGCLVAMGLDVPAGRAALLLTGILALSVFMQWLAKRRHIKLGADQLDYIEQQLKASVQTKMAELNA